MYILVLYFVVYRRLSSLSMDGRNDRWECIVFAENVLTLTKVVKHFERRMFRQFQLNAFPPIFRIFRSFFIFHGVIDRLW